MDTSSIAAELQELQQYQIYEPIVRRLGVAAAALFIWDFIITFDDEVTILWGTKWSTSRILFFINRYFTLVIIIISTYFSVEANPNLSILDAQVDPGVILVSNIEIILLRRLFVLYDYRRVIVISMVALFIGVWGSMMGLAIAINVYSKANEYVILGICVEDPPSWFQPFWNLLMAYDFLIMVLAGFKSVQSYRRIPDKHWFSARFTRALARDSFVYFASNFSNYLIITIIFRLAPPQFDALGASWAIMIPSVTVNHLLINMEYSRFTGADSTINTITFSDVEFVRGFEAVSFSE
ncbi:hypothetical protein M405DRAFT_860520 [Rhizopogon salebrosus TDB-379]|nr:hypothetical protein M405DRAFT_860520 [Rhizopogon salebrosus TDB-379]